MRSLFAMALLLFAGRLTCAGSTIHDVFHESQANCQYSYSAPYSNCDVIGNPALFDIDKADVMLTQSWIDVTIYFNYGGGAGLDAFRVGSLSLLPGDVFFYDPANPSVQKYGAPLVDHGGLSAGSLYAVVTPPLTAFDVLHDNSDYYRRNQPVWLPAGEPMVAAGTGVTVVDLGSSDTHGEYAASVHIARPDDAFWNQALTSGHVGIAFESATCGNDVLVGVIGAPEPGAAGLLGIGIAMIFGAGFWKKAVRKR